MKNKPKNSLGDPILTELAEIKRLLMLGLLNSGATQSDIAKALGVSQGTVSKMFPKSGGGGRKIK
jgi:predicted transcriptional regulator